MKIKPNLDLGEHIDDKILNSPYLIKLHIEYLFTLVGFGIGSLFSLIAITIEDYTEGVSTQSVHSHWYHLAIPFFVGIIGAFAGYLYSKHQNKKNAIIHELLINHETLNLITDNLPVLISYIDLNFRYQFVNKTHEKWFGLSVDDFYGKQIEDIVGGKRAEYIYSNIRKSIKGEIISFENTSRLLDGEEHFTNSVVVPHFGANKKAKGFFTIVSDITNLKEREILIKKQNDELTELNSLKDRFFSIIAHDLKNPFNSILGLSGLLFKEYDAYNEETKRKIIASIYEGAQNAYKLLENLLFWARSQQGAIKYTPSLLNLKTLIDENIALLNGIATSKNIHLHSGISKDMFINSDKDLLNAVIRNLISNAIKFTRQNGEVVVSEATIGADVHEEFLAISVKDNGVGMSEENKNKLFKIAENSSTQGTEGEQGTGLGLILCWECVEKCGGKIWVDSEEGKGSTFNFTISDNP